MLQLLQPIWLFALAGLSIPVIIHLWNQRPGKTLRVGSVMLVAENLAAHKKSIQLTELLLLLLRCLLLASIALALAAPLWRKQENNIAAGWILTGRSQITPVYTHFKPTIDSLLQTGFEFHYFEEGFAKANFKKALETPYDSAVAKPFSYRSIIAALNEQAGAKQPLYVFTDNYLRNFSGTRPVVSLNLHWFTYTPDTAVVQSPAADTSVLHVTLYCRAQTNDGRYIKAALDALQQFSKKNIITRQVNTITDIPAEQDWLFWLSDEAIPAGKKAAHVLAYATGKAISTASYVLPAGNSSFDPVELYSFIIEKDTAKQFLTLYWQDGFGRPLLAMEEKNNTLYYRLYTHIDPAWNELPWSNGFPQMLSGILFANGNIPATQTGKTIIDSSQLMPVFSNAKDMLSKPALFSETKLAGVFWLIAFVLLVAERCLSFYQRKIVTNG